MIARVGTLAVGTRFVTLLTGRQGRVHEMTASLGGEREVVVQFVGMWQRLHPDVRVRVEEVTH